MHGMMHGSIPYTVLAPFLTLFSLALWYWRRTRRSISYIVGPPSDSWLVGSIPRFIRASEACEADFKWTREYGNVFRYKGCFNEDVLYIADPKALQYIKNKRGYNYQRSWENRVSVALTGWRGVNGVDGAEHARHRRVMAPSFSNPVLKQFIPLFSTLSQKTVSSWRKMIHKRGATEAVLNVVSLVSLTALDAIVEAAFGYKFNAVDGVLTKTELQKSYEKLMMDVSYMPSDSTIILRRILAYAPSWVFKILTSFPKKDFDRLKKQNKISTEVAKSLFDREMEAHARGKEGGKDVMSVLIRANITEDPRRKLLEKEILAQINVLMIAGHETTANTVSCVLYELSKRPEMQRKLRSEIRSMRTSIASRGDTEIQMHDLDSMKYMSAVMKETLRYHTVVPHLNRMAVCDDIIPLDTPARTVSGDTVSSIPIRKGQQVHLSLTSYNRLKSVWGEDADEWKPERFLEENSKDPKYNFGPYGNIGTFGSGLRVCIGWRFSVIEIQVILTELLENFEFSPAPNVEIKRGIAALLISMVKGQEHLGKQLPLKVSIISESAG